jgi:hypothetical protein
VRKIKAERRASFAPIRSALVRSIWNIEKENVRSWEGGLEVSVLGPWTGIVLSRRMGLTHEDQADHSAP